MFNIPFIRSQIVSALTQHDGKQSKKHGFNRHALPLYLEAVERWEKAPQTSIAPFETLADHFTTRQDNGIDFSIPDLNRMVKKLKADPRSQV